MEVGAVAGFGAAGSTMPGIGAAGALSSVDPGIGCVVGIVAAALGAMTRIVTSIPF